MWLGFIWVFLVFIFLGILDVLIGVLKEATSFSGLNPWFNIRDYFTQGELIDFDSKKRTLRIKDLVEKKDFFIKSKIWISSAFVSQCFVSVIVGGVWSTLWFYVVGIRMETLILCPIFFWTWFSLFAVISALFMAKEVVSLLEQETNHNIKKWWRVLYWVFVFIPSVVHIFWDIWRGKGLM